jgi:uncharacterized membrane protein
MMVSRVNINLLLPLAIFFIATPLSFARPGNHEMRDAVRDAQRYQKGDRDSDRYGQLSEPRSSDHSSDSHSPKKAGRLSPEERKALRQQINEAGQDLYSRRR